MINIDDCSLLTYSQDQIILSYNMLDSIPRTIDYNSKQYSLKEIIKQSTNEYIDKELIAELIYSDNQTPVQLLKIQIQPRYSIQT